MKVTIDGEECELVREYDGLRGIVNYRGIYIMVDRLQDGGWDLSGEPARPGQELDDLNALAAAVETTLTITKDS